MKKLLCFLIFLLLVLGLCVPLSANENKIIDEANVLSDSDKETLNSKINEYIEETGYDIVIYFAYQSDYFDKYEDAITNLADDTFDNNGYGLGDDRNGLIMCVDVHYRDFIITTCGSACIDTYTDNALNDMYDEITPYLAEDDWANGAKAFVENALGVALNYDYFHVGDSPVIEYEDKTSPLLSLVTPALGGATILTLVVFLILRGQLKHTGEKHTANNYMSNSNINISRSGDVFLYRDVRRHKIERKESNYSSGSSVHTSSSGTSHGGGGSHRF